MRILVTGGCGFIGTNLIRSLIGSSMHEVVNLDKLGYAANPRSLADLATSSRYAFCKIDLADSESTDRAVQQSAPDAVIHLAAESHVDRSIDSPSPFVQSNILGTYHLLDACLRHFENLERDRKETFRFLHVSTDEVYGSLPATGSFNESSCYQPRSPYAASKASADHLARAWQTTYGLPVIVTNCSNNFGPYQFPEKLIPLAIIKALRGDPIPLYGDGQNVRDWLFVEDHVRGLRRVLETGQPGESYNLGGGNERTNLQIVQQLCDLLDEQVPRADRRSYSEQITMVADRPGHDFRYAIDFSKIQRTLGWRPGHPFDEAMRLTVCWYLEHRDWWEPIIERGDSLDRQGERRERRSS